MGVSLSIKDVPEALAEKLRQRAERNHRSLQGELMALIERAALEDAPAAEPRAAGLPAAGAALRHQGWKSVRDLMTERRLSGWQPAPQHGVPLAVDIVRAARDSR